MKTNILKKEVEADINPIGQRLRLEMKKRGLTSAELAKRACVKTSFLYDIISGKSANPSTVKIARVADSLGVSLAYLVGMHDTPFSLTTSANDDYVTIAAISPEEFAMGIMATVTPQAGHYYFHRRWITEHLAVAPVDLRMLHLRGDLMEPALHHGDMVLIDTTRRLPSPSGVFILFEGTGLVAKRIDYVSGGSDKIRISCDNPRYTSYDVRLEDTLIIGRVVWFAREL